MLLKRWAIFAGRSVRYESAPAALRTSWWSCVVGSMVGGLRTRFIIDLGWPALPVPSSAYILRA